jgi:hypothetical protein
MRNQARQNLQVAAVNAALERQLITLDCTPVATATFEFELGGLPVLAQVHDAGFDEVHVNVIVAPTALARQWPTAPVHHQFQRFGAATTFGCLERRDGKYLQTSTSYHGTKTVTQKLSKLSIAPNGFGPHPSKGGYDFYDECARVLGSRPRPA